MRDRDAAAHPSPSRRELPATELLLTGALAAAVTLVSALLFYGFDFATGVTLLFTHDIGGSDIWHLNYPMKHFYQEGLAAGRLPLWCPEIGTGFPLHAEGQVGAFYPPNLLLYGLLPLPLAFNWSILLSVVLAGAFCGMLTRQFGAPRAATAVAAIVFAFSGFFVTHVKHINMTASAVWIPLMLLLIERYAHRRSAAALILLAIAVASTVLAGHPQIVYNNLLVAGGWAAVRVVWIWAGWMGDGTAPHGARSALAFAGGLFLAVGLGVLLGMPQILPTQELNALGPRQGGMTLREATQWEYQPKHLGAFFVPGAFGDPGELVETPSLDPNTGQPFLLNGKPIVKLDGFQQDPRRPILYWEMTGYVGLLPLLLAAAALVLGFRRRWGLGAFLFVMVLLTLGKNGGLFHLLWHLVPAFKFFRFHDRFLVYVGLALAVLAALGIGALVGRLPEARRRLACIAAASAAAIICLFDIWFSIGDHNPQIETARWTETPEMVSALKTAAGPNPAPYRVAVNDPGREVFTNAYFRARGWKGDLAPYDPARNMLDPNLNLLHDVTVLQIYYQLYPRWMLDAANLFFAPAALNRIADIYNVRFMIHPTGATFDRLADGRPNPRSIEIIRNPTVAKFDGDAVLIQRRAPNGDVGYWEASPYQIALNENRDALPRAFLVPQGRIVRTTERPMQGQPSPSVAQVMARDFDPRKRVILALARDAKAPKLGAPGDPIDAPVKIDAYEPHEVRLSMDAPHDCWLFASDTYYPGWEATVNGRPAEIYRANIAGRAVAIPQGKAEVVFTYRPTSVRKGLWLALIGILLTAALPWILPLFKRNAASRAP